MNMMIAANPVATPAPRSRAEAWASAEAWAVANGFIASGGGHGYRNKTLTRRFKAGKWERWAVGTRPRRGEVLVVCGPDGPDAIRRPQPAYDGTDAYWERSREWLRRENAAAAAAKAGMKPGRVFVVDLCGWGVPSHEIPWYPYRDKLFVPAP